jgi:hypothetical protein
MIENMNLIFLFNAAGFTSFAWINQIYSRLPSKAAISADFFTNSRSTLAPGSEKQQRSVCILVQILL